MSALDDLRSNLADLVTDPDVVIRKQDQTSYHVLKIPTGQFVNEAYSDLAKRFLADLKAEIQATIDGLEKELEGL